MRKGFMDNDERSDDETAEDGLEDEGVGENNDVAFSDPSDPSE